MRAQAGRALVCTLLLSVVGLNASAQVHRCVDGTGKISYSDQPCATSSKRAERVLGSDATDRRWENEAYGRERNMRSIENATRILREPTSDAVGDAGGGIIQSDPNERIRAQDERNMQRRMAEIEAGNDRRGARRQAPQAAPPPRIAGTPQLTRCDAGFCYDNRGESYFRNGDFLMRKDGRTCQQRIGGLKGQLDCN